MVFLVTKVVHGRWLCMGTAVFAICTHACIVCVCMCGFEWEIWMSLVFKLRIDYICYCGAVHYLPAAQSASAQPSCFNWQRTYIIQYIHTIWMQKERERNDEPGRWMDAVWALHNVLSVGECLYFACYHIFLTLNFSFSCYWCNQRYLFLDHVILSSHAKCIWYTRTHIHIRKLHHINE